MSKHTHWSKGSIKKCSKWRTNTHNLARCHHSWWNHLFKIFKDKARFLSNVKIGWIKKDKKGNFIEVWTNLAIIVFPNVVFDTNYSWYFICYIIMTTNLSFTTSYQLLSVPSKKCWCQQKGQHIFKFYIVIL